ncbi:hypothetical protein ACFQGT_01035 [Natrialbaceae archaeon GCM10025810]|uniref:DUF7261 family protein n=1 Tax=Halovalidus salilacus TaxID=3075124 RepID=UPI00360E364F
MVTENADRTADRGQLILIGAIAIAFIVLGTVVVFNGLLYTETISSSSTDRSASDAEVTIDEIERGLEGIASETNMSDEGQARDNISTFNESYQNQTSENRPAIVNISVQEVDTDDPDWVRVRVVYDSSEVSFNRTVEIDGGSS